MALRRDTSLRLHKEVPGRVLVGLLDEFSLGPAPNSTEAIRLITECEPATGRVEETLREYAGRFSVFWLVHREALAEEEGALGVDGPGILREARESVLRSPLTDEARQIDLSPEVQAWWAEDRNGDTFIRFIHQVSERYQQVGLDLVPAPVVKSYSLVLRPRLRIIEIRAPWTYFQDVVKWAMDEFDLDPGEWDCLDLRGDESANELQEALAAILKRARHKHDTDHDYDTVEVTPNPHRNDGDLSQSALYQEELAVLPGRGKHFAFQIDDEDQDGQANIVQVAQTNLALYFRTMATERLVSHVLGAALRTAARTPVTSIIRS